MSAEYEAYMLSPEWANFKERVFQARGRKCEECGCTQGELNVHHLHYRSFRQERLKDVRVLCKPCHDTLHRIMRCY